MNILIRGASDPLDVITQCEFIIDNCTGGNIGNMLFTNSVSRALYVSEDTKIDYINLRKKKIDDKYIEFVNQYYDVFIIPLANAFKIKGHDELNLITEFVKKLTIPCCIIGVGIQQLLSDSVSFYDYYPYNDDAKNMLKAVLDKSPIVGVRGEYTADYLKALGFIPEKDFTVIGCPSMYTYGANLPKLKKIYLTCFSRISFNSKVEWDKREDYSSYISFMKNNMSEFSNSFYLIQNIQDMRMLYLDTLKSELRENKVYNISDAFSFTNVHSWLDYYKKSVDFSIGTRIHGGIAAVLGGVPSVFIPFDKRVDELVRFHNLPYITFQSTKNANLYDIFNNADFTSIYSGHKNRFDNFLSFLHTLGLETIYDYNYKNSPPYDNIVKSRKYPGVVKAFEAAGEEEKTKRYREAFLLYQKKLAKMKKDKKEE